MGFFSENFTKSSTCLTSPTCASNKDALLLSWIQYISFYIVFLESKWELNFSFRNKKHIASVILDEYRSKNMFSNKDVVNGSIM